MDLLYTLVIGGLAGWIASSFMKGRGMGIIMNIILGIIGAFVGTFLFSLLSVNGGVLGMKGGDMLMDIVSSTFGAVVVLFIARVLSK
ncbi:MAG: putative membrane protein YeaQ/YmgE (transglycosylase-associated protein family) [Aureispira sp.]|jgi:uncharacterized membrane protein YeaQ/YmgE (transglycosylase-associated protein family)